MKCKTNFSHLVNLAIGIKWLGQGFTLFEKASSTHLSVEFGASPNVGEEPHYQPNKPERYSSNGYVSFKNSGRPRLRCLSLSQSKLQKGLEPPQLTTEAK